MKSQGTEFSRKTGRWKRGGLARITGSVVVALSALSQEYGSGINFVVPHGLGKYPQVDNLVPLAIFVAGVLLIPQVVLFSRFVKIMPNAGSSYVWVTRSVGPTLGFATAFMWLVGLCGAMGFIAYVSVTFVSNTLASLGIHVLWLQGRMGHLVLGAVFIWTFAGLHCSGVKRYGYFVYGVGALVLVAAGIIIVTGFITPPSEMVHKLGLITGVRAVQRVAHPSPVAFFSVVALFIFAYGGLSGGASLGGEARNPTRSMPRGIVGGWGLALVLYTLVAFALFHAVPWWSAKSVLETGHGYILTVPSLIGILTIKPLAAFLNALIAIIVIKTLAPQLLSASRFLFAWAEDGFITRKVQLTNRVHAPAIAIIVAAVLGTLFLVDAVFSGWSIGVAVRAVSLMLVFTMLGLGILRLEFLRSESRRPKFASQLTAGWLIKCMAVAAVVIGPPLIVLVSYQSGKPWYLEPWLQVLITILCSLVIYRRAKKRARRNGEGEFAERFLTIPEE